MPDNTASETGTTPGGRALAFIINSVEFVNHYRLIWELLGAGRFEVIAGGVEEKPEDIRQFVVANGFRCRTIDEVVDTRTRYRHLVSHHPFMSNRVSSLSEIADRQIRFMYGLGKGGWNFNAWNRFYDVILCFGPHQKEELAQVTDSLLIEMGYPRFDSFFDGRFDRLALADKYHCDPTRRTLVWLPTWSDLASVSRYQQAVSSLSSIFNVVVKLHPFMRFKSPDETAAVKKLAFNAVIDEPIDNVALYVLADWVLADYGGPMFGAIYTDRDLMLLDLPNTEGHEFLGQNSPDLLMRRVIPSISDADPDRILGMLLDDGLWSTQRAVRAELRRQLFAPYYGCSAQVAAAVLSNIESILRMQGRQDRV
jgi:hypothetical protein